MKKIFIFTLICSITPALFGQSRAAQLSKVKEDMLVGTKAEKMNAIRYCGFSREKSCYYILLKAMEDIDPEVRAETAGAIGLLEISESIPYLKKALENEKDLKVKKAIIQGIGYTGFISGASIIVPYLTNDDVELRLVAARALAKIRSPYSLDSINSAIESEKDDLVRVTLIYASLSINRSHPENVKRLAEDFFNPKVSVRYQAALAAAELKFKDLLEQLKLAIEIEEYPWLRKIFQQAYVATAAD